MQGLCSEYTGECFDPWIIIAIGSVIIGMLILYLVILFKSERKNDSPK